MKTPRNQSNIVVDLGYDKLKISNDTLLVHEDWSAHIVRVVVPCSEKARGNESTFSSGNFSDGFLG